MIKFWLVVFSTGFMQAVGPYESESACKQAKVVMEEANKYASVDLACVPTPMLQRQEQPIPPAAPKPPETPKKP